MSSDNFAKNTEAAPQMRQDELERMVLRQMCEDDHLFFTRYFFKMRENQKFLINWHHVYLSRIIDRILTQDDGTNYVINIAPGSSKTEMFVINLMARGLALNSWSRFLHISSSDDLVLTNSQKTRDLVESEEYQALWPARIANDAKSTRRWNVEVDGKIAGGVYAVPLGGQITGFRAGRMAPGFNGAIIIDDPLKADDGFSKPAIKLANRRLLSTVKSRKARPDVPTIVVMQRLNPEDCTGFIQGGNLPGKWEFVEIPALLDDAFVETLPEDIRPRVGTEPRDEKGRFSYWEYKEPLEELLQLEAGNGADSEGRKISSYVFMSQYQQRPKRLGGNIIHGEYFVRLQITPRLKYRNIYGDTAQKIKEANDFSVMEEWGLMEDGRIFLGDMLRGKFEAPDLLNRTVEFWNKSKAKPPATHGHLRALKVEDKSSGTGLIQEIKRRKGIPVFGIPRDKARKDKLTRVMDALPYIEAGMVCVPADAPWLSDFIAECEAFTADDTHAHDDQIDPLCDAIMDLIGAKPGSGLNAF